MVHVPPYRVGFVWGAQAVEESTELPVALQVPHFQVHISPGEEADCVFEVQAVMMHCGRDDVEVPDACRLFAVV